MAICKRYNSNCKKCLLMPTSKLIRDNHEHCLEVHSEVLRNWVEDKKINVFKIPVVLTVINHPYRQLQFMLHDTTSMRNYPPR